MVEARKARGGTLVLGGGFAGWYVARLLGSRGATIVSLENFMLDAAPAGGRLGERSSRATSSCRCG